MINRKNEFSSFPYVIRPTDMKSTSILCHLLIYLCIAKLEKTQKSKVDSGRKRFSFEVNNLQSLNSDLS